MSSPRPTRHRAFVTPGYFEGYLEKLESKNKKYKKYWAVLRGNHLYFQVTCRDPMYIEKINLDDFVAVVSEDSRDTDLQATNLTLKLKQGDVKLKTDSLESREQWKGFIHTVAKLEIPKLDLLPGQFHRLKEVLEEEIKQRRKSTPPPLPARPVTPDPVQDVYDDVENLPSCYYKISRVEAEVMLEKNVENGNFLMRPGSDKKSIAITTRQMFKHKPLVKHYRIRCAENGYVIEVEGGILCSSKQEVINYFVQHTNGVLKPLERSMDYEVNMSFVQEDAESGEVIHQKPLKAPTNTSAPAVNEEKPSRKIPEIAEPEAEYFNDYEIEKLNQVKVQLHKEALMPPYLKPQTQTDSSRFSTLLGLTPALSRGALMPPRSKLDTQAEPSGFCTLPRLTPPAIVNSELQLKLQRRRAAMNDILPNPPLSDPKKQ
ncbi:signal-transducing adaptor protein 1-like isoform X2 [Hemiscyllium ocellatum]|uniref:signal-transducing adaptor protein 1-like isoform X2 n=1 Tax=Hemiscyllium ocellatum TaxID=170820 RepID=UPI0029675A59|nr:signal-transducing adaptor protein 1-like isoform X2 [Hemiscyllium ocellatum]